MNTLIGVLMLIGIAVWAINRNRVKVQSAPKPIISNKRYKVTVRWGNHVIESDFCQSVTEYHTWIRGKYPLKGKDKVQDRIYYNKLKQYTIVVRNGITYTATIIRA